MLRSLDLGALAAAARQLGVAGATAYLLYSLGVFALLGGAWWSVARGEPVRRIALFAWARLVREAVADLLPFSQVGGLVFGARTLVTAGVPNARAWASITGDLTTEMASQLLFTLFSLAVTASLLVGDAGAALRPAILGATAGLVLLVALILFGQRPMLALGRRVLRGMLPDAATAIGAVEAELAAVYADRARVALSFAFNLAGWIASAAGAWLLLRLIGVGLPFGWALAIEGLIFTVRSIAFAVPGALGFQEAAYVTVAPMFGLPPETALVLSLAKRARELAIGLPVLLIWQWTDARGTRRSVVPPSRD